MNKAYERINWENYPSENTALNEANLNKMDAALNEVDNRVVAHETTKLDVATANSMVKNVSFNERSGIFTITYLNGSTKELDTKLEKIATNFVYDEERQKLILTLIDGTTQEIDMSALVTQYEFENSAYIKWTVVNGKVKAEIINGSITADKLQPNFLADVTLQANSAKTSEQNAKVSEENAKQSEINAKNYADSAEPVASTANGLNPTLDNSTGAPIISFLGDGETIQTQGKYLTVLTATDGGVKTNKITCKKGDVIILSLGEARGLEVFEEHSDGTTGKIVKFGTETTWTHTASANTVSVQLLIVGGTIDDNITITVNGSEYAPPSPTNEVPIYGAGESRNSLEITASTETKNGITSTVNSDKSVTFSGAYASMTYFLLGVKTLKAGTYKISGCPSGGGYNSYTLRVSKQEGDVGLATDFGSGVTLTLEEDTVIQTSIYAYSNDIVGKTFYPMIRLASVEDETYKAYGAHSLKVKSTGKNFINATLETTTVSGVTCTKNGDGTYTLNGTASGIADFDIGSLSEIEIGKKYKLVGCPSGGSDDGYKIMLDRRVTWDNSCQDYGEGATFTAKYNGTYLIWIRIESGTTLSNLVFKPMLTKNLNATYDDFEPYTETTADIPLNAPLYESDYIRLNMDGSGEESHKIYSEVFDGGESGWLKSNLANMNMYYIAIPNAKYAETDDNKGKVKGSCTHFNMVDSYLQSAQTSGVGSCGFGVISALHQTMIGFNTDFATVDEWKAWLAENPITVVYELAEPTVTPLTAEQIAEFEKLRSFDGTTHVTCEAESEIQYFYDSVSGKAVAMVASKANTSAELPIGSVIMIEEQNTEKPKYGKWSYLFTQTLTGESGGTPRAVSVNVYQRKK